MRISRAMASIVRPRPSVKKPSARADQPERWTIRRLLRVDACRCRRARSSCGSTSSRWPCVAAGAWALVTHGTRPHAEPHLPWWAVALGFACAEICVVHVRFRRSAHSFSLADLPFVFGLVFATGDDVRARRARRHRHRLGPGPPAASSSSSSSTSPSSRSPRALAAGMLHAGRRRRRRAAARDLGRPLRRHAGQRRADDPAARRRDRDRRGQPQARRCSSRCSPPTRSSR